MRVDMKDLKKIKDTTNLFIDKEASDGIVGRYFDRETTRMLSFIFSWGEGWEHLSVSMPRKCPTWEQMCRMKDIFWRDDEVCVEYHPRRSDYVNIHPFCLHIWKPINKVIPTPPKILV